MADLLILGEGPETAPDSHTFDLSKVSTSHGEFTALIDGKKRIRRHGSLSNMLHMASYLQGLGSYCRGYCQSASYYFLRINFFATSDTHISYLEIPSPFDYQVLALDRYRLIILNGHGNVV